MKKLCSVTLLNILIENSGNIYVNSLALDNIPCDEKHWKELIMLVSIHACEYPLLFQ